MSSLNEIRERAAKYQIQEIEDDGDHVCGVCGSAVHVPSDMEWESGDACDRCLAEFGRHARKDIPWLIAQIEALGGLK